MKKDGVNIPVLREAWNTKSFKKKYYSFEEYCKLEWGISRCYAYLLINGRKGRKDGIPRAMRWEVWERDDFTCVWCGTRRYLTIHHKHPESLGGPMTVENMETACDKCNGFLSNKTREWQFISWEIKFGPSDRLPKS